MEDHSDLLDALTVIDPSTLDYQGWLDVGMALHESGLPLEAWDEWSAQDARRYHDGECASKWAGFGYGETRVTSGTLAKMATDRGWVPPAKRSTIDRGVALEWDGEFVPALLDPSWVEPTELPEMGKSGPEELIEYLGHLYDEDDIVGYVMDSWDREGKWLPKSKGCYSRTAGELMRELKKYGSVETALGAYNTCAGAWIRINPLDGKGVGNANVTEYRYALVESDTMSKEMQLSLIRELQLPCAAVVDSGNKSLHAIVRVDASDYGEYRDRVMRLYDVCRKNGLAPDTQNKNPSRLSRMPGVMRAGKQQKLVSGPCGKASWSEWWDWMQETTDDLPDPENLASEWDDMPELAPPLIDGVLRQGHKMLLAGPSKAGKSFALIELCISLAEGRPWFGWNCAQGRVLYVNLELDSASCLHRFRDVYAALGYAPENVGNIDIWNLRGRSVPMDKLTPSLIRRALKTRPIAVVIDPIYKVITGDENSADQMAAFCNQFDKVAQQVGCAVIYCHHHSKGTQGQKRSMDRASGSGVFARDPDALLDMTALEMTDECMREHYDLRRRQAMWAAFDRHMPGWRSDERFVGADSADQLQAWANEPANGAPYALQEELSEIYDGLETAKRGWAAWRIEGTLREFASFKPKSMWFEYPVHVPDETGALGDLHCEGEFEPTKRFRRTGESARRGRETKAKNDRTKQDVKIDLMRDAIAECAADGVEPTRENVLERINKFDGEQVTKSQLLAWTRDKAKWSPFRVKDDGSNALYDTTDVAFEFDGEIDLSGVLD